MHTDAEDFDTIMRVGDDEQASDLATEMFGNKAPLVLMQRERVNELNGKRIGALEHFRKED
jgi:hypothetical protein